MIGLVFAFLALSARAPSAAGAAPAAKPHHAGAQKKGKAAKAAARAAAASAPARAHAPPAAETADAPLSLKLDVHRATLANGLRVVIDVDHGSPTVAISVVYDVGARDEERGRSGFAHLLEHMMFQGTRDVPKGAYERFVAGHGGELDGSAGPDRTRYAEVLPAGDLAPGLWFEADRMRSLDVSEESFESQRKVIGEERRVRVEGAAYEPSRLRLEELVYQGYWPYEHAAGDRGLGSLADLDAARLEWAQAFHAGHYGPNNAVLAIAGDVDADAAMALAHQYFDDVPRITVPSSVLPALPEQTSQRAEVIKDDHARTPGVFLGWAVPPARSVDHYALDLAGDVLAGGESSRLHQLLVRDRALVRSIAAGAEQRRGPDLFRVEAVLAGSAKPAEVEKLIEAEIKALATRGPTEAELGKARRRIEARFLLEWQSNLARARRLGDYELFFGDARLLEGELPRYLAVTRDDVQRAAAQHLGPTRRSLVETVPGEGAEGERTEKPAPAPRAAGQDLARPTRAAPAAPGKSAKKAAAKPKKQKKP